MKKIYKISKKELKRLYLDEKLSIKEISNKLKCSHWSIWKSMHKLGIKSRSLSESNTLNNLKRKIIIEKEVLEYLYSNKKLSTPKIARMYNCRHSVILNRLKENNMERRDAVEANTKYQKKDFEGNNKDKAYMLGFALGDLNVTKPNKNGRTIVLQGNSTIPEQINLIQNLYRDYGSVKISDIKTGFAKEKRITVNLNDSFNFLLYKKDKIPDWILSDKNTFFAFLSGYIDAEGHIRTDLPTCLSIGSSDKHILNQINKNLKKYGLNSKLRISAKKGYTSLKKKTPYNKDMWQVGIYSKESLLKLFDKIKPYIRHENKIDAMLKSIEQVNKRNEM